MQLSQQPHRWVLFWMCVVVAVNQVGFGCVIPVLPLYAQSFGVSHLAIGAAVAIYGLSRFLAAIPTGRLADWLGRRPTLALGGAVSVLGNLWCALATSYTEFLAGRFVAGAGATLVLTGGIIVLADITTPRIRGRTMAIYQGAFMFAVGLGPLPGGLLADRFGLSAPFYAYSVAGLVVGLLAWFAVKETRGLSAAASAGAGLPPFLTQLRLLTARLGFFLVCVFKFMQTVVRTGCLFAIVPVLGHDRLGLSATQIGVSMAIGSVIGLLSTYPAGVVADRFGRKMVIVPGAALIAVALLLFCYAPAYVWFVAASVAWGASTATTGAAPAAYAADNAPPGMNAAAMSGFRMLADAGYVVGPILVGALVDAYGANPALIGAALLMTMVGVLFARLAPETYRSATRPESAGD